MECWDPCRISKINSNQEKFLSDLTGIHRSEMRRKKCLSDQNSCFRKEPSFQNIVFLCCCSSEFLSEIKLICCRIEFFWKIFLSDKLALTDETEIEATDCSLSYMAEYVRHLLKLHKTHEECCVLNSLSKCNAYASLLSFLNERWLNSAKWRKWKD